VKIEIVDPSTLRMSSKKSGKYIDILRKFRISYNKELCGLYRLLSIDNGCAIAEVVSH
jgi:hypothetical protein